MNSSADSIRGCEAVGERAALGSAHLHDQTPHLIRLFSGFRSLENVQEENAELQFGFHRGHW